MSFTFIRFMKACEAQGLSRDSLPYKGWGQPYVAWYALTGCFIMTFVGGYTVFLPGSWDLPTFFFSYTMIGVFPILFVGWKLIKRTKWQKPAEVDLIRDLDEVEEYTRNYVPVPPKNRFFYYLDKATN
jgi:amino acid transporter